MTTRIDPVKMDSSHHVRNVASRIGEAVLERITAVPTSVELESATPLTRARAIRRAASRKALGAAGALALPPGPLGWLTILPELGAVWRIQSQMVADIAAAYGKSATLTREQVAYCLFRHTAAQALREVVVQVGERFLVQKASVRALQAVARQVGIHVSQRSLSRAVSRWIPIVGAAGVGAFAYYDTTKVARTAIDFFGAEIEVDGTSATESMERVIAEQQPGSARKTAAAKKAPRKRATAPRKTRAVAGAAPATATKATAPRKPRTRKPRPAAAD